MKQKMAELTTAEADLASRGELCPFCRDTTAIKCVGSSPDGRAMNYAYDCLACGGKWEGY